MVWSIIIWKLLTCWSHQITEWWQIQQKWNNQRIFRIRHQFHNTAVNFRLMCCPQMIQNSNHRTDFCTFILGFKTNRQNSGDTRYVYLIWKRHTQKGFGTMVSKAVRNSRACSRASSITFCLPLKKDSFDFFASFFIICNQYEWQMALITRWWKKNQEYE